MSPRATRLPADFCAQVSTDDFIDAILGTRKYVPCLYCYNKVRFIPPQGPISTELPTGRQIDAISLEEVDRLAREPNTVVISCELDLNLDYLCERIWKGLALNRIYTKRRGEVPDLGDPLIVKKDASIEQVVRLGLLSLIRSGTGLIAILVQCDAIHRVRSLVVRCI